MFIADDICLVRSMNTDAVNHAPGVTFFLTGSRDPVKRFMPAAAMDGWVTDLRAHVEIDGAGHWVNQERPREVGDAWAYMCPAGVYEIPDDAPEEGMIDLIVNPSNCVQCGAITAKGGRLTTPEGGDGPLYQIT